MIFSASELAPANSSSVLIMSLNSETVSWNWASDISSVNLSSYSTSNLAWTCIAIEKNKKKCETHFN